MSCGLQIVSGEFFSASVTIEDSDGPYAIPLGATVKVVVVSSEDDAIIEAEQDRGATGANWDGGIVVVEIDETVTADLEHIAPDYGSLQLWVTETDGPKCWLFDCRIVKGHY